MSILLSVILVFSLFTVIPSTASASTSIRYIDENGDSQRANGVTEVTSSTTAFSAGWYAVTADTEIGSRITCQGDVELILCDGATLTAAKGISVKENNSLTIYGQSGGTGALVVSHLDGDVAGIATGGTYGAGIGGCKTEADHTTVNLSWRNSDDSIRALDYNGTVMLNSYFRDNFYYDTKVFLYGKADNSDIENITLVPYEVNDWSGLQALINGYAVGNTITLDKDYTAGSGDTALTIPANKELTLDLNGYTLDRNLSAATANGNAITNNGTLYIIDSSLEKTGTITGGADSSAGGAILNNGTLTIEGDIITGNTTTQWGGAGILNAGTMTLNGGTISGNNITTVGMNGAGIWTNSALLITGGTITGNATRTGNGGGIYYTDGTVTLSGSPVITGNSAYDDDNNLYINGNYSLTVNGVLTENAKIGVRIKTMNSNAFTNGLSGNGTAENFISDDSDYEVRLNPEGEAVLIKPHTVTVSETEGVLRLRR